MIPPKRFDMFLPDWTDDAGVNTKALFKRVWYTVSRERSDSPPGSQLSRIRNPTLSASLVLSNRNTMGGARDAFGTRFHEKSERIFGKTFSEHLPGIDSFFFLIEKSRSKNAVFRFRSTCSISHKIGS